jgi:hypothetical protein
MGVIRWRVSRVFWLVAGMTAMASSQTAEVLGRVVDSTTGTGIRDVSVMLRRDDGPSLPLGTITAPDGSYRFGFVVYGRYRLILSHIACDTLRRSVFIGASSVDLGTSRLRERMVPEREVVVRGVPPPVEQIGDTTQFYADAFAVNKDASAEDLVSKLPGLTMEGTSVRSQGEDIRQVLVDGRQFFSDDPMIALRNLPAEIIERVQVYDKLSDQAELTGFDDGQSVRTMNIITRLNRRQGMFGKTSGGYGTDARYATVGTVHDFDNDRRLSLFGISNNVNQQNFTMQDILGVLRSNTAGRGMLGGGRFGGGLGGQRPGGGRVLEMLSNAAVLQRGAAGLADFLIGEQGGLNTTHSLGATYGNAWNGGLELNGNYFVNRVEHRASETLERVTATTNADSARVYAEENEARNANTNHRAMLRTQVPIDELTTLVVHPRFSVQVNEASDLTFGRNAIGSALLNTSEVSSSSQNDGWNGSFTAVMRRRSDIPGRSLSVQVAGSFSDRGSDRSMEASTAFPAAGGGSATIVSQKSTRASSGSTVRGSVTLTEPVMVNGLVQATYAASTSGSSSERLTYALDSVTQTFAILRNDLSSEGKNRETSHRAGFGFRYGSPDGFRAMVSADVEWARMSADLRIPVAERVNRRFRTFLPIASVSYRFSGLASVQAQLRSSTQTPSATQLQRGVDNTNPVQLTTGNPKLAQSVVTSFIVRLGLPNPLAMTSVFATLIASETNDAIVNDVTLASADTTLPGGIVLHPGTQLTRPVNIDGQRSLRGFLTYGFPVHWLGSNLNLIADITASRTPAVLNGATNWAMGTTYSGGFTLVSTFSQDVDLTLSYAGNHTTNTNSLLTAYDEAYDSHRAGLRASVTLWDNVVLRTDATYRQSSGRRASYRQEYLVWNGGIGIRLFSRGQGEITLSVFDILEQNTNLSINTTDLYTETQSTNALGRHFLLTFSYTLRAFDSM